MQCYSRALLHAWSVVAFRVLPGMHRLVTNWDLAGRE